MSIIKNTNFGKYNILSLFANIGIAEAYLHELGFNVVLANELEKRRADLYSQIYNATEVILYTKDRKRFIKGNLKLTKTGRCKIDEVTSNMLADELFRETGFSKSSSNAKTYYVVNVEKATISDSPYNGISYYVSLKDMIKLNELNSVLFRTSPKVIDV